MLSIFMQTKDVTIFVQMFGKCYSHSCSTMDAPNNTNQTYVLKLKTNGNLQKSNYGNFDQRSETKGGSEWHLNICQWPKLHG